jgi:lipid A 4'-phosphatase
MSYLRQTRTQLVLLSFLISTLLLVMFPGIDIHVSKIFFNNGFNHGKDWWNVLFYNSVKYFLNVSVLAIIGIYLFNKFLNRDLYKIDGRKTLYLILVLVIGAGVIVNTIFKDHFGRARPRDIIEFNGAKQFTPVFAISDECDKNCSFSSGHGAGAFFALAIAYAFNRRKALFVAALTYGSLVSLSRIASGGHFFSDNVVSFFVMLITSDVLYYYMFMHMKSEHQTSVT